MTIPPLNRVAGLTAAYESMADRASANAVICATVGGGAQAGAVAGWVARGGASRRAAVPGASGRGARRLPRRRRVLRALRLPAHLDPSRRAPGARVAGLAPIREPSAAPHRAGAAR